jgi:hypothetical protein
LGLHDASNSHSVESSVELRNCQEALHSYDIHWKSHGCPSDDCIGPPWHAVCQAAALSVDV